jgi:hypothetical protein
VKSPIIQVHTTGTWKRGLRLSSACHVIATGNWKYDISQKIKKLKNLINSKKLDENSEIK